MFSQFCIFRIEIEEKKKETRSQQRKKKPKMLPLCASEKQVIYVRVTVVCKNAERQMLKQKMSTNKILKTKMKVTVMQITTFVFCYFPEFYPSTSTGWPKSHVTQKKLNIYTTARPNGFIFLPRIEACSHSKSIRARLVRTFVKYHY